MSISVADPVGAAFTRTGQVLFKPFDIGKWFVLGFCAFLAYLGEGGGSIPSGPRGGGGGGGGGGGRSGASDPRSEVQNAIDWITANLGLIILIGLSVMLVVFVIGAVLIWLRSRGKFMFIDGIVNNRGAVVEPWKRYRPHGNSLFMFSLTLMIVAVILLLAIFGLAILIAWPDISSWQFTGASITSILVTTALLLMYSLSLAIIGTLTEDFVVPTMYRHNLSVMTAWSVVGSHVLSGRLGTIVLYFLMKIVLSIAIGITATIATCATCCIVAIPYLGTVILLPLYVFIRCYALCFLEQLGPEWQFFPPASPPQYAPVPAPPPDPPHPY